MLNSCHEFHDGWCRCSFYGFQDITPSESRSFYDWFFAKGVAVGMKSFEPDFMNQNYNCVPDFIEVIV